MIAIVFAECVLSLDYFLYDSPFRIFHKTHEIQETDFFHLTGDMDIPYVMASDAIHHFWWNAIYKTNSSGLLGDENSTGSNNLLFVGDSVTFGVGVQQNETFPEILRGKIAGVRIAIAAVPGYTTEHEIKLLKEILNRGTFRPNLVIFQFSGNDYDKPERVVRRDRYYFYEKNPIKAFGHPSGFYKFLLDHSNLFFRAHQILSGLFSKWVGLEWYPNRYHEIFNQLAELKPLAEKSDSKILFVCFPDQTRLSSQRLSEYASFQSIFEHVVDLGPLLVNEPTLWFDPWHPNAKGHELIASAILGYVSKQHLLNTSE